MPRPTRPLHRRTSVVGGALLAASLLLAALWWLSTQPFVQPLPSTPPAVDPAQLQAHVRALSQRFHPRSFEHPQVLAAAADHVHAALAATGATVERQPVKVEGERFDNLVARFGPADGPLLVIGAHYDSHGHTQTPGADDNASGVAGLIELARLLVRHPPSQPVELVAYTLEEPPHFRTGDMGSARHAGALAAAGRPVELMISLEMIGYFSDAAGSQHYPVPGLSLLYPDRGNFIGIVSRPQDWRETRRLKAAMLGATPLPVRSINTLPQVPGVDFSDHLSYWQHGMPAVMVTDTAFARNVEYHQAGDTHERLDYRRMAQVVQGVFAFVHSRSGRGGHK